MQRIGVRRSGVIERAEGLAVLRGTDWVAWIQEGVVWAAGINLQVSLLRRRADLELSIICGESRVATQRYSNYSSRELGGGCRERDGGDESERQRLEVSHIEKETASTVGTDDTG